MKRALARVTDDVALVSESLGTQRSCRLRRSRLVILGDYTFRYQDRWGDDVVRAANQHTFGHWLLWFGRGHSYDGASTGCGRDWGRRGTG